VFHQIRRQFLLSVFVDVEEPRVLGYWLMQLGDGNGEFLGRGSGDIAFAGFVRGDGARERGIDAES